MPTYLSLGSNLGDRARNLSLATMRLALAPGLELVRISSVYETAPWGDDDQPPFLNLVLAVRTTLTTHELLRFAKALETDLGRTPTRHWGPRVADVDILLHGDIRVATPDLVVPHAHIAERQFVLVPLAEIAPEVEVAPGVTAGHLARPGGDEVRRVGTLLDALKGERAGVVGRP